MIFLLLTLAITFEIVSGLLRSKVLSTKMDGIYYSFGGPNLEEVHTISVLNANTDFNKNQDNNILEFGYSSLSGYGASFSDLIYLGKGSFKYKIKKGDTLSSIADRFQVTTSSIIAFNNLQKITPGSWILINQNIEEINQSLPNPPNKNLPYLKNYFSLPTQGWNWGILHDHNAVDIANQCGTPVFAAADGVVTNDPQLGDGSSGWNNGYGVFVLLEHPNGTKTRYAHLDKALVKIGDIVKKGQKIGLMGNTGDSKGPTGCHLHFEVYGAQNPFAIY